MKTFEERFTAWVDGTLLDPELAEFERELSAHPEAAAEKKASHQLGRLLREHPTAPALVSPDFFALQIQQRLVAETAPQRSGAFRRRSFWSLPRLVWAGATCLILAGAMIKVLIPSGQPALAAIGSSYFAQVVESWPGDPSISASTVYNPTDNVTVLWLDGLDYLPASYTAQ